MMTVRENKEHSGYKDSEEVESGRRRRSRWIKGIAFQVGRGIKQVDNGQVCVVYGVGECHYLDGRPCG